MKSEGLKLKVEGPLEKKDGSIGLLKGTFVTTMVGVESSMNAKHTEAFEERLGEASPKKLSILPDGERAIHNKKGADQSFTLEDHRCRNTFLPSARTTWFVSIRETFYEIGKPCRRRSGVVEICRKGLKGCPDVHLLHRIHVQDAVSKTLENVEAKFQRTGTSTSNKTFLKIAVATGQHIEPCDNR